MLNNYGELFYEKKFQPTADDRVEDIKIYYDGDKEILTIIEISPRLGDRMPRIATSFFSLKSIIFREIEYMKFEVTFFIKVEVIEKILSVLDIRGYEIDVDYPDKKYTHKQKTIIRFKEEADYAHFKLRYIDQIKP